MGIAYVSVGTQHELIFNPDTSALMDEEDTVVGPPPSGTGPGYPVSTLADWVVYLSSGVVNSTGVGSSGTGVPPSGSSAGSTPVPAKATAAQ
ncbi:MAG TPA: hypothetical protein VNG12_05600 [Acidimicrobiales bacterium]|nr:hypothetical protein [Acidimicrobiales bacterium]